MAKQGTENPAQADVKHVEIGLLVPIEPSLPHQRDY